MRGPVRARMRPGLQILCLLATTYGDAQITTVERPDATNMLPNCGRLPVSARTEQFVGKWLQHCEWRAAHQHIGARRNGRDATVNALVIHCSLWTAPVCPARNITEYMLCMFQTEGQSYSIARRGEQHSHLTKVRGLGVE